MSYFSSSLIELYSSVLEHLPSTLEALGSMPSTNQQTKNLLAYSNLPTEVEHNVN